LKETKWDGQGPYQLFNRDVFPHNTTNDTSGLYGSVPYITSHSTSEDSSILWNNAAETFVDIWDTRGDDSRFVDFSATLGIIDMFIFGDRSPKLVQKKLSKLTGFTIIPPWYALGFHYSRWEDTHAYAMDKK